MHNDESIRSFREGSPTGAKPLPPIEDLHYLFRYDPEKGTLHRREGTKSPKSGRPPANSEFAGSPDKKGYLRVRVSGRLLKVHRIIWALYYGEDPGLFLIDHIDRNPSNNRISNLRLVTHRENVLNKDPDKRLGISGIRGVSISASSSGWTCHDPRPGCRRYLGTYRTLEEAERVVNNAENQPTVGRRTPSVKQAIPARIPVRPVVRVPRETLESKMERENLEWHAKREAARQAEILRKEEKRKKRDAARALVVERKLEVRRLACAARVAKRNAERRRRVGLE